MSQVLHSNSTRHPKNNQQNALLIAAPWLKEVSDAASSGNVDAFVRLFREDGWFRDILCFSWDFKSLGGHQRIKSFLSSKSSRDNKSRFLSAGAHSFKIETNSTLGSPEFRRLGVSGKLAESKGVQGSFTFSLSYPPARGRGYLRISKDNSGKWKAYTLLMSLVDLIGYEEPIGRDEQTFSMRMWSEIKEEKIREIERDPTVLIIGCGQAGAMVAAAMQRLGLRVLVVERTARVGDVWRNRYPNLTLNSSTSLTHFLYHPWPKTYPLWIPKDVYADFMESYVAGQNIHVWLSSSVLPLPTYNSVTKRWTVQINRSGKIVTLTPKHIVTALGTGSPNIPKFEGTERFVGEVYHSDHHRGAERFRGKRAIVIGAGNAGADMCRDFIAKGASEVTIVQRSAIAYITRPTAQKFVYTVVYPDNRAPEDGDLVDMSTPLPLVLKNLADGFGARLQAADRAVLEGLNKIGYKTTYQVTPETGDTGYFGATILREGSGQLVDPHPGFGSLVIEGKVKVKHGVEIKHFEEDGVVFEDGTKVPANVVVLATGNKPMIETVKALFGNSITDIIGNKLYGLDEDGELTRCYRPTGHPGLWFAVGATNQPRLHAKHLALQILAEEVGLKRTETTAMARL